MLTLEKRQLVEHFTKKLKIEKNAMLWVHVGIKSIGVVKDLKVITRAFKKILVHGTLIIPAFSYSWCKNERFTKNKSMCQSMGSYSKSLVKDKSFKRTNHPNFSVFIMDNSKIIKNRSFLKNINNNTCFGKNSIFDLLYKNSKFQPSYVVLLGGAHDDVVFRTTFIHYVEQFIGVQYRYLKKFFNSNKTNFTSQYVRYFSNEEYININHKKPPYPIPVKEKYKKLGIDLIKKKLLKNCKLNYSLTRVVQLREFVDYLKTKLKKDKKYLLK